jgi:LacI family transcriptional regulator
VTSQEIASLCGVSKTTVSRVINNDPNVREKTRRMILDIIEKTNYVPVASARRLAGIESNIIGLFIVDLNIGDSLTRISKSSYFSQLGNMIIDQANNAGYQVLVSIITTEQLLRKGINLFISGTISSGIIVGAFDEPELLDGYTKLGHPIVIIDQKKDTSQDLKNTLVINLDNFRGGYEATQHLIRLGHTRIGHISGDMRKLSAKDRYDGYKKALLEAGIPFDESLVYEGEFQEEGGYRSIPTLVGEKKVTALFSSNDAMAIGAIKAIKEMNLEVPRDVSIIGFDNIEVGQYISPGLSTMHAPLELIAQQSLHALLHYMKEGFFTEPEVSIPSFMVLRDSTASLR